MRWSLIGLCVLATACSRTGPDEEPSNETLAQPADPSPSTPAESPFDWTGTWAATEELCTGGRWRFARDGVVTDGHTSCTGTPVDPRPGGVTLAYACEAEGVGTRERWSIERISDGRMRVRRAEGDRVIAEVELEKCE